MINPKGEEVKTLSSIDFGDKPRKWEGVERGRDGRFYGIPSMAHQVTLPLSYESSGSTMPLKVMS